MKPKVLLNEKHRKDIERLNNLKKQMDCFDRNAIESIHYDLTVNRPIQQFDVAYLRVLKGKYL